MELNITARTKGQEGTDYLAPSEHGLTADTAISGGDGSPESPFRASVRITNHNNTPWLGVIHIRLPFPKNDPRFFLPAFLYGTNRGETPQRVHCEYPRLREGSPSHPSSPWWMTRSDRLSHPAALVYDSQRVYGLSASPYFIIADGVKRQWYPTLSGEFFQYAGFSCSLDGGTVGYTLGYENAPTQFINAYRIRERAPLGDNCFALASGEAVTVDFLLYDYAADSALDINQVIKDVYRRYHQHPRKSAHIKAAVSDLSRAVFEDAWMPEDRSYAGQVFEEPDGGYRFNKIYSLSWTNGLSVATPMLLSALRLGDEPMREQALDCIENILTHSINPANGLPFDAYTDGRWCNKGWWFDGMSAPGHSSYLCGQALFYILKAYEYEKRLRGCVHGEWLDFVRGVLLKTEQTKNTDKEYPYIFSEESGAGIEYDSLSGAWCMAALAYYSSLTGDRSFLKGLTESEGHYHERFVRRMECYGAPLDTCKTVDSEGVLAYIKAIRYLHELTGESRYLAHMRDAIDYEFSFKFCYNSPIKVPPLSKLGWSSCGGSVTSVSNPHIHPMSSNIIGELLYYVNHSGDEYVRDRTLDTIGWSLQTYNTYDREFDHGKKGWMSERFCHSEGLVYETYPDGTLASTWFCLMPWAAGSILDGLAGDCWDFLCEDNTILR